MEGRGSVRQVSGKGSSNKSFHSGMICPTHLTYLLEEPNAQKTKTFVHCSPNCRNNVVALGVLTARLINPGSCQGAHFFGDFSSTRVPSSLTFEESLAPNMFYWRPLLRSCVLASLPRPVSELFAFWVEVARYYSHLDHLWRVRISSRRISCAFLKRWQYLVNLVKLILETCKTIVLSNRGHVWIRHIDMVMAAKGMAGACVLLTKVFGISEDFETNLR